MENYTKDEVIIKKYKMLINEIVEKISDTDILKKIYTVAIKYYELKGK